MVEEADKLIIDVFDLRWWLEEDDGFFFFFFSLFLVVDCEDEVEVAEVELAAFSSWQFVAGAATVFDLLLVVILWPDRNI